ncbi:MAG TPA: penicillin-binding protein [Anaerolineales bacterium]|nr:penicillin-binding protein [Anaerolineales bacterium]
MPTVSQIIQMRRQRHATALSSPTSRAGKLGIGLGLLLCLIAVFTAIGSTFLYAGLASAMPSPESLPLLLEPPSGLLLQPTRLYDRTGQHLIASLQNPRAAQRRYLTLDEDQSIHLPAALAMATIASSDPNFWSHGGFSWQGVSQGNHPTLAQKLVSDLLLWDESPGLKRALRERLLAAQITTTFGRQKILEWYLNSSDYGQLAYGADAAALTYFGKSATDLTLAEAAALAATTETPALNLIDAPKAALERKDRLLETMFDLGFITATQFEQAKQQAFIIQQPVELSPNLAPAFTKLVLEQLGTYLNPYRLPRGGLSVITTLDYNLQSQTDCATETQLNRLKSPQPGEVLTWDQTPCQASRLLPTLPGESLSANTHLAANVVVLDPAHGQVLAMVGDASPGQDPARLPGHPPGSLMTPFIYLTAFTRGMSPASLIWDIPASLLEGFADIRNPDDRFHGPIRLRMALANDYLVPAIQVLVQMGPEQVWSMAKQLGLASLEVPNTEAAYRLPLQGGQATLLNIAQAYGVFANQGVLVGQALNPPAGDDSTSRLHAQTVLRVEDHLGRTWLDCSQEIGDCRTLRRSVISSQLAYLLTNILSDETARWPSLGHPNPLEIGRAAGAKIGRTVDEIDSWTVGYSPGLVVGVWLGNPESKTPPIVSPKWSAGLWHAVIQYALQDQPNEEWTAPPGISPLKVCDPSGMLPTADCPMVVDEVFINGSEPSSTDTLFRAFQINRETGRLATAFTPAELVERRVYLVLPPEAETWAQSAGLPLLPETYDVIDSVTTPEANSAISSPAMFSSVKGWVPIRGHASGKDFDFFNLQFGQGLNPVNWLQIGEDSHTPIANGQLAVWDTAGLNGLYTLQLLVVDQDQNVDTATIQVTVDNQPPEVSIRFPARGEKIPFPETKLLTLQADASDDLGLVTVEFFVDDQMILSLALPPYVSPWTVELGRHVLRVRAVDRAGNFSEAITEFFVDR